jgi:hypothetical protein
MQALKTRIMSKRLISTQHFAYSPLLTVMNLLQGAPFVSLKIFFKRLVNALTMRYITNTTHAPPWRCLLILQIWGGKWSTWPRRCARASACVSSAGVHASSTKITVLAACSVIPACYQT